MITAGSSSPKLGTRRTPGAPKTLSGAPQSRVDGREFGVEWQIDSSSELTLLHHRMNRTDVTRAPHSGFEADALRMQLQFNF